jgi:hypothetical protein
VYLDLVDFNLRGRGWAATTIRVVPYPRIARSIMVKNIRAKFHVAVV